MTKKFTKKRRNIVETMIMIFVGVMMILPGFAIFLISIPFLLIIVGIFPLIGGGAIMFAGFIMIKNSFYKSVNCTKCQRSINPGLADQAICATCKNVTKFKDGN